MWRNGHKDERVHSPYIFGSMSQSWKSKKTRAINLGTRSAIQELIQPEEGKAKRADKGALKNIFRITRKRGEVVTLYERATNVTYLSFTPASQIHVEAVVESLQGIGFNGQVSPL